MSQSKHTDAYHYAHKAAPDGAPLLFLLHGTGGDERQLFDLGADLAPGSELVAPRGDVSEHGAARFFRRLGEGVYDMDDLSRAVEKFAGFVRAWKAERPAARVQALGYSNGANIIAAAMIKHADLFDSALLLHPLIPWESPDNPALAGKRVLMTSGARDPICPPAATAALAAYFKRQDVALTESQHDGGHEIRPSELSAARAFLAQD